MFSSILENQHNIPEETTDYFAAVNRWQNFILLVCLERSFLLLHLNIDDQEQHFMDVHWLISEELQTILQWYQGQKYLTAMVRTLFHLK